MPNSLYRHIWYYRRYCANRKVLRWVFPQTEAVSGNHFTVICPTSPQDSLALPWNASSWPRAITPCRRSLIYTIPINPEDLSLLEECLTLHSMDFTPPQAIRKVDAEYWLPLYESQFGIRLRMIAGMVDRRCRAFLMFHEDPKHNLAVVDYLVSRDENELDQFAIRKLLTRLRDILRQSGIQYVVFEVARPIKGPPHSIRIWPACENSRAKAPASCRS